MWRFVLLAVLIALGGAESVQAQTKKELVAKMLQLQQAGVENMGRQIAGQIAQRYLQATDQALSRLPADKREATAKDVQADVKKFYDEVEPLLRKRAVELAPATLSPRYEERFNEDELRQAIAWLESPVSKKLQQVDGEFGNVLAQKVMEEMRPTIEAKRKTLEASLDKRLGAPAPATSGSASGPKK
jgi:predicted outer membrane protein